MQEHQGLVVIGITENNQAKVVTFVIKNAMSYPLLLHTRRAVNNEFGVTSIPRTVVYNRNGKLAAGAIDMRTQPQLMALLGKAIS